MIKKNAAITVLLLLFCYTTGMNAQLTPQDAIKKSILN
jgi:hypothetical protein